MLVPGAPRAPRLSPQPLSCTQPLLHSLLLQWTILNHLTNEFQGGLLLEQCLDFLRLVLVDGRFGVAWE